MSPTSPLSLDVLGSTERIELTTFSGVVAGYTGRDAAAVQHHIDELAAIGIAPPPEVPMFYPVQADAFTAAPELTGSTSLTSGEVEPVYIRHGGRCYLGIGSDHTDRDLEAVDIGDSKRACPKPLARQVVEVGSFETLDLDAATARCWVDGRLYQEGTLNGILTPADVVKLLQERTDVGEGDFVCLGGTLPLLDGRFVAGRTWRVQLELPDGRVLDHTYTLSTPDHA